MEFKNKGNDFFKNKNFQDALNQYTKGINSDFSEKYKIYSNRSATYLKLDNIKKATLDAVECCLLNPKWDKGWLRLHECLKRLDKDELAKKCYDRHKELSDINNIEIPKIVPNNQPNMQDLMSKISSSQTFQNKMNDNNFIKKLEENKSNPFALLSDPLIMNSFNQIMKDIS